MQGLRVLELAAIGPVPLCGMLLADQGADVVRIDRVVDSGLGVPLAPRFDIPARSRRSVALDLKHAAGRDAVLRLIDSADVLIEGFRPGVAEALGLGPEVCVARQPSLVYGRMTGWGQSGPLAPRAGHDLNYLALSGVLQAIGPAGGDPVPPLNLVGDYGGGALYLAFGVMAALFERQRSGRGQVVDAAMLDGIGSLTSLFHGLLAADQWQPARGTNLLDGGAPFYACYRTACGGHLSVAALEPKFFAALVQGLGLAPGWLQHQHDRSRWTALRDAIGAAISSRSRDDWAEHFERSDACVAPVLSFDEAARHPQAQSRAAYIEVAGVRQPAPAPRFDRTPAAHPRPAPEPGQDTVAVLLQAGLTQGEIDRLLAGGVASCGAATSTPRP
ncbi:MAG: CaiB/BaiF CoA-transferase family protein [Rubrivivax sp.]